MRIPVDVSKCLFLAPSLDLRIKHAYADGQPTEKVSGFALQVVDLRNGGSSMSVRIIGETAPELPADASNVVVSFVNLTASPYVRGSFAQVSYSADSVRVVGPLVEVLAKQGGGNRG